LLKQIRNITIILISFAVFTSCRAILYNIPDISDHKIFPCREIQNDPGSVFYFAKPDTPSTLGQVIQTNYLPLSANDLPLDQCMEGSCTAAFLIIRNDSILYEKYCKNYQESSIFNIFSVTKAFMTTLVGIAIRDGMIISVDQSVTDYIPELKRTEGFEEVTIRHLLLHTAGIRFSDSRYNPFSDQVKYYYGRDLRRVALDSELCRQPGIETSYSSANVQLLAIVLERATGRNLSSYLQDEIWNKIGMQYNATWSLDNRGEEAVEKGFSNLNCTAIDLAKLGRLYLNRGVWDSNVILPKEYIQEATRRDTTDGSAWNFQYNFRLGPKKYESFYSRGLYGQLIYVYPEMNMIIVRIGEADRKYNPQFMNHIVMQIIDQI